MTTTNSGCRWLGEHWRRGALLALAIEDREAAWEAMRCGAPTVPGTSWCRDHLVRVNVPPDHREPRRHRRHLHRLAALSAA